MKIFERKTEQDIGQNIYLGSGVVSTYKTWCCSLLQISLENECNIEDVKNILEHLKKQSGRNMLRDGGERAVFVIAKVPGEEELVEKLKEVGFKFVYEFHRRKCYNDEETMLQMWIYSW